MAHVSQKRPPACMAYLGHGRVDVKRVDIAVEAVELS
jgi:hypothetical protein